MKWTQKWIAALLAVASTVSIVDTTNAQNDGVFIGDTDYAEPENSNEPSYPTQPSPSRRATNQVKQSSSFVSQASHSKNSCCEPTCGACCDQGCDSMCASGGGGSSFAKALKGGGSGGGGCCAGGMWANAEFVFWFAEARQTQPLITSGTPGTIAPIPGPGVQTLFGGDIDPGMTPGFRFDAGKYFGPGELFGLGASGFYMGTSDSYVNVASNGADSSLGRFFYDSRFGPQNAVLVAGSLNTNPPTLLASGTATGESELDYYGAQFYGRIVLGRCNANQLDVLGGYSVASIQDLLQIQSVTNFAAPITSVSILDRFDTSNVFQGGHLGANAKLGYGRMHFDMTGKVHLGNMNQTVTRVGQRLTIPGNIPQDFGVLNTQNLGTFQRDVFTYAPEMNMKIGIDLTSCCMVSVGYSFIYYDHVALADDQIDRVTDPIPNGGLGVPYSIQDTGFWFQSLDLGVTLTY